MFVQEGKGNPPWNFSWIVRNKLAAMACPHTLENLMYLVNEGVSHLITLSPETKPPAGLCPSLKRTVIPIIEFEAPTVEQIQQFIEICKQVSLENKVVGIHCRMGKGRTGVMAACYLVWSHQLAPERAIVDVRLQRPGSIETYEQEMAVKRFHDMLRANK